MKNITLILALVLVSATLTSSNLCAEENSAEDYFPMKLNVGYYYNFVQGPPDWVGKLFKYQKCVKREVDGGELTGTFHDAMYVGSVRSDGIEIYSVRGNEVFLNYVKSVFGDNLFTSRPIALKIPKKGTKEKWDETDRGEKSTCTSEYVSTLKTAFGTFQNVIKMTKTTVTSRNRYEDVTYYAKGIGMIRFEMGGGKDKAVIDLVKVEDN